MATSALNPAKLNVGVDVDLYLRWRNATSPAVKRLLLGQLITKNEPLVRNLIAQQLGRSTEGGARFRRKRLHGSELLNGDVGWEDALNAGRVALAKAFEGLDPEKGALSTYLAWKVQYELQKCIGAERFIKSPRGTEDQFSGIDHFEDPEAMERVVHEHREATGYGECGAWDEYAEPEDAENDTRPEVARVYSLPAPRVLSPLEQWILDRCSFGEKARVSQWDVWKLWRNDHRGAPVPSKSSLTSEIIKLFPERGLTTKWVRGGGRVRTPDRGLAGLRIRTDAHGAVSARVQAI